MITPKEVALYNDLMAHIGDRNKYLNACKKHAAQTEHCTSIIDGKLYELELLRSVLVEIAEELKIVSLED